MIAQRDVIDVLIVGGGPAGLAAAIQAKRRLNEQKREASVVVIDKAVKVGYHCLSGGVMEGACLDELLPGWREEKSEFVQDLLKQTVQHDTVHFLTPRQQRLIPAKLVPAGMHHTGDLIVSVARLADWLGRRAAQLGVEVYAGFSAYDVIVEDGVVRGVVLGERGVDRHGKPRENYQPAEEIRARVTVMADGAFGPVSTKLISRFNLDRDKDPQVYSLGVKQIIRLPETNNFGANRVVHTMGYPNKHDVMGGGFLYAMGPQTVAVGLVLGLDWRYYDLNPQQELELFKEHPFVQKLLEGGEVLMAGAKTIPEGGWYAMPALQADGALLVGDAAGLVNMAKIKGLHLAVRSGLAAGDTVCDALAAEDFSAARLAGYSKRLEQNGVLAEMRSARNVRQGFATPLGLYLGAPLAMVQKYLPFRIGMKPDREHASHASVQHTYQSPMDRKTFVGLSGTMHDEELRSHIRIADPAMCDKCRDTLGAPCIAFCPGEVYAFAPGEGGITVSPADCMHCRSCAIKCPFGNVTWVAPEGGAGPKFRQM